MSDTRPATDEEIAEYRGMLDTCAYFDAEYMREVLARLAAAEAENARLREALRKVIGALDAALHTDDDLPVSEACEEARRLLEAKP